ncbi:MAG TPA: hypothetical protein VJO35_12200 [Terriglobales bacterium]|nr:hypothetical protein [Terriglobales bacterium]
MRIRVYPLIHADADLNADFALAPPAREFVGLNERGVKFLVTVLALSGSTVEQSLAKLQRNRC